MDARAGQTRVGILRRAVLAVKVASTARAVEITSRERGAGSAVLARQTSAEVVDRLAT
jgi:hypothetical protein